MSDRHLFFNRKLENPHGDIVAEILVSKPNEDREFTGVLSGVTVFTYNLSPDKLNTDGLKEAFEVMYENGMDVINVSLATSYDDPALSPVVMMKKVVVGIALIVIMLSVVVYNHLQQPNNNDIFNITKKWSTATEEVILIREIDGQWLTIFRNQHGFTIAELEQNWLGIWQFRTGRTLGSSHYPPSAENQITWQASESGEEKTTFYFCIVMDPEIDRLEVETRDGLFEDIPFIETEGNRFFFKGVEDESIFMPVTINGISKSGKLVYSSFQKVPDNQE